MATNSVQAKWWAATMRRRVTVLALLGIVLASLYGGWRTLPAGARPAIDVAWTQIATAGPVADVGVGPGGEVWITGTDSSIAQWNGTAFVASDGAAVRVAVGPNALPWVVTGSGDVFNRPPTGWAQQAGMTNAADIAVGANGDVWYTTPQGDAVMCAGGNCRIAAGVNAARIAVAPNGLPWVVRQDGSVGRRRGAGFETVTGLAQDIGIGANGAIWATAPDDSIWLWTGSAWDRAPGVARFISVGPDGSPWVVNRDGNLFRGAPNGATVPPAATPTPAAAAPTLGSVRPVLALLCNFADVPNTYGVTADQIQSMFVGDQSLDGWVREMSYGAVSFAGSRAMGWYTLPKSRADYLTAGALPLTSVSQDCVAAAQAAQVDVAPYTYFAVFINDDIGANIQGRAGTIAVQVGGQQKRVQTALLGVFGLTSPPLVMHEFGHLFSGEHTTSRVDPLGGGAYLGDNPKAPKWPLPLKSTNFGPGYNAYNRDKMGWIPAARKVRFAGGTQQVTLTRLTQPGPDGALMVEIPFGTGPGRYTVEVRTRVGYDAATQYPDFLVCAGCFSATQFGFVIPTEGVYIHRIDNPASAPASAQVPSKPGGDPTTADGIWLAGQTYTDAANNISIRIDRFDANGAAITITGPAAP